MATIVLEVAGWGGGPWFLFFPLVWIALFAGVLLFFRRRGERWHSHSAREILSERYARGEISADEYRQAFDVLCREGA